MHSHLIQIFETQEIDETKNILLISPEEWGRFRFDEDGPVEEEALQATLMFHSIDNFQIQFEVHQILIYSPKTVTDQFGGWCLQSLEGCLGVVFVVVLFFLLHFVLRQTKGTANKFLKNLIGTILNSCPKTTLKFVDSQKWDCEWSNERRIK